MYLEYLVMSNHVYRDVLLVNVKMLGTLLYEHVCGVTSLYSLTGRSY